LTTLSVSCLSHWNSTALFLSQQEAPCQTMDPANQTRNQQTKANEFIRATGKRRQAAKKFQNSQGVGYPRGLVRTRLFPNNGRPSFLPSCGGSDVYDWTARCHSISWDSGSSSKLIERGVFSSSYGYVTRLKDWMGGS
jgi:hypothetical protein